MNVAKIEEGNIESFRPQTRNANKHSQRGLGQLESSMRKHGYIAPMTAAASGEIIDGSARLETVANIFDEDVLIVEHDGTRPIIMVRSDIATADTPEAREISIAANRIAETNLAWDAEVLLADMQSGIDLSHLFDKAELDALLAGLVTPEPAQDPGPQIDKAEELRVKWGVELGQLWRLGAHRLICGDCTDAATVARLMGGERADMVFTDPPYNVSYQSNESIESLRARNRRTDGLIVQNDAMSDDEFDGFLESFLMQMPLKDGGAYYLCAPPGRPETQFRNALNRVSGLALRECIVWVKDRFVFGRQDYHWRHESILYGWKEGASHYFVDDHTQDTVWEIKRPTVSELHPTMKPVELPVKAISNSSQSDGIVYEPFSGSGTTLIACEQLSRQCRAIEISPAYVAVAIQRWADATGQTPVLSGE